MELGSVTPELIDDLIRRAEEHHDAGRYEEAYAIYTEGIRLAPDNARLYAERGNELSWLGRRQEAVADLSEAIRRDPTKAYYFRSRGFAYTWVKDDVAAIRDFTEAIRLEPEDAQNYCERGTTYQRTGDQAAALRDFTDAIRLDPENPKYYEARAKAGLNGDDPDRVRADFQRAIELGSARVLPYYYECLQLIEVEDWDAIERICLAGFERCAEDDDIRYFLHYYSGRSHYDRGRYAEALEPLAEAARLCPDGPAMVYHHALCLWDLNSLAESIPVFDEVIRLDPTVSIAWYRRGYAHWMLGHNERALADATEALRLVPGNSTVLELRANVWLDLDQPEKALEDIGIAIREAPEERGHRLTRAAALQATGQSEQALGELQDLIAADPSEPQAYGRRALILQNMEEYDDALDAYERYAALGGTELTAMRGMGTCHTALGDDDGILRCFSRARELDPTSATHRFFCGYALNRMGDTEEARAYFSEVIAIEPDSWQAYWHRGSSWATDDQFDLALADYTRAIELGPEETKLRVTRADLYEMLDDFPRAIADYDEIIRLNPDVPRYYWQRAALWEAVGDTQRADADVTTAEKLERAIEEREASEPDEEAMTEEKMRIWTALQDHFGAVPLEQITLTERHFPVQVGADVQRALEALGAAGLETVHFWVTRHGGDPVTNFADAYIKSRRNPVLSGPPRYQEIDIGEAEPVQALRDGLWLLKTGEAALAVILDTSRYSIRFQVAALTSVGPAPAHVLYRHLEETVRRSPSYRGKVLSLESREMYSGQSQGLRVHRLRTVPRDEVILPRATLELLDRNVTRFVQQRASLIELGLSGKKGLLFYGPPGTGKTHTIHYLAQAVPEQTTFLISADQVGVLDEYMTLARLFQPSLVVIEDVDLIARQREEMRSSAEEVMLNKLLNEMDGLQLDAQVLFVLTTNRLRRAPAPRRRAEPKTARGRDRHLTLGGRGQKRISRRAAKTQRRRRKQ